MNKRKSLPILLSFTLMLVLFLAACGGGDSTGESDTGSESGSGSDADTGSNAEQDEELFITIATGGTSGVYYPIGGAMSNLFERELGHFTSVQATGASVENINLITTGRAELAITMGDAVLQAYEGTGAFEGEEPVEELRGMASLYPNHVQIVTTAATGITEFEDLRGKRVGVGAPNSGVELNARMMFEAHGMTYDDVNVDYLSYSEAIDQIKNGLVDAAFVTSGLPNATIMDLQTSADVVIVPIEGAAMDYLAEHYPFFSADIIPANTYDNTEDIHTASIQNLLLVSGELSEDAVYVLTKTMFENIDRIQNSHNAAKEIDLEGVAEGMIVPFHPGAEKYLKEVGAID
ncbi:TAXI family TRAP transporter solute-binding subunit [Bacillus horti]|uniref:TRAP transporter TAXI family solute receptor n=1 Tax=Caldalkalibacillus horti TaxID=77523 RepID=A0ABT9VU72_9BACI|nr:TAXI family TRAP transporter solute-binding subunit [Bacillus horti]MDQ0164434.1 TRAP transporter TAXI family solute receptor [Bacillus horti]